MEDTLLALNLYVQKHFAQEDGLLKDIVRRTESAGLDNIQLTPSQGKFLQLLVKIQGARRILEVGTLGGYSGTWLARALPAGGTLTTLEIDPTAAETARSTFSQAGLSDRVTVLQGDAISSMKTLLGQEPFDFVFIDANKQQYPEYYEYAMRLVRPGSVIVLDNVVQQGNILDSGSKDPNVRKVRDLNAFIGLDPRVEALMVPTYTHKGLDGFLVVRVK